MHRCAAGCREASTLDRVRDFEPEAVLLDPTDHVIFSWNGSDYPVKRRWAEAWQRRWDELEERLVPDRDQWIGTLLDVVDAVDVESPTVLDLACGTGTVTRRLLERRATARTIALDVDPVLLTIASATFDGDDRVRVVRADLRDPRWTDAVPEGQLDATLTAAALHWLPANAVSRLYRDLARLIRPGGVVAHAEVMPLADLPILGARFARAGRTARGRVVAMACRSGMRGGSTQRKTLTCVRRAKTDVSCSRPVTRPRSSRRQPSGTSPPSGTLASLRPGLCGAPATVRSWLRPDNSRGDVGASTAGVSAAVGRLFNGAPGLNRVTAVADE